MKNVIQAFMILSLIGGFGLSSHGQDKTKKSSMKMEMSEPTKEQRNKMATVHDQMAACLRSDKSMKECHQEMKKTCMEMGDQCPMMMDHHGMGKMMHMKEKDENK